MNGRIDDSDLPKLQSIQLGAWALQGDISEDRKNTLTMRSEIE